MKGVREKERFSRPKRNRLETVLAKSGIGLNKSRTCFGQFGLKRCGLKRFGLKRSLPQNGLKHVTHDKQG